MALTDEQYADLAVLAGPALARIKSDAEAARFGLDPAVVRLARRQIEGVDPRLLASSSDRRGAWITAAVLAGVAILVLVGAGK